MSLVLAHPHVSHNDRYCSVPEHFPGTWQRPGEVRREAVLAFILTLCWF